MLKPAGKRLGNHLVWFWIGLSLLIIPWNAAKADGGAQSANSTILSATNQSTTPGYMQRRSDILNYFLTVNLHTSQTGGPHRIGRMGFFAAEANFLLGNDAKALTYVQAALSNATAEGNDGGFSMWPGIDCYLRWSDKFPQALKDQYKAVYTTYTNYKIGQTPNQKFMMATARYLASQIWDETTFAPQTEAYYGTSDPTGKAFLESVIRKAPFEGLNESDSRIYSVFTFAPMKSIADLSNDPNLSQNANMAIEWTIARAAGSWLNGHWAVSGSRTNPDDVQNSYSSGEFPYWLFFGGAQPSDFLESGPSVLFCNPEFSLSDLFEKIANDRSIPYTNKLFNYRNDANEGIGYYKSVWMNKQYALYSEVENDVVKNPDNTYSVTGVGTKRLYDPHQMQRWGIMWNDPNSANDSLFFVTNPHDPNYHNIGTTLFENVVQNNGTLAAVYNIPTTPIKQDWNHNGASMPNYQELYGEVPAGFLACINDSGTEGRIYLYYNSVLISLSISKNFNWDGIQTTFTVPGNKMGLVVETALPDEYPGNTPQEKLTNFKNALASKSMLDITHLTDNAPKLVYTDRNGVQLDLTYGGERKINGIVQNYDNWPVIENSWMNQQMGSNLLLAYQGIGRIYNFNNWTVSAAEDHQPPATEIQAIDGQLGAGAWNTHDVTVQLTASDGDGFGVAGTVYSLDQSPWTAANGPIQISGDGYHTITYHSVDFGQNWEDIKQTPIWIDQTPPVITLSAPAAESYGDSNTLVPSYTVNDEMSGVDGAKTILSLDGQVLNDSTTPIQLYTLPLGLHALQISASDLAGNTSVKQVQFQTMTSMQDLKTLVSYFRAKGWIDNEGIANSLQVKLDHNGLAEFMNEVSALSGKHINSVAATYLLRDSKYLSSMN